MTSQWVYIAMLAGVNVLLFAVAWGDIRRQVQANRERQDERHEANQDILKEIRDDVKRINGEVTTHGEKLEYQGEEIDRLRRRR